MNKRGFTMVEVIIVVAIIAILASIILPKMSGARDKAKLEACKANLRHIGIAMALYANDNRGNYYPPGGDPWDWVSDTCYLLPGGYLKGVPVCPAAAGTVTYNYVINEAPAVTEAYVYCNSNWAGGSLPSHPGLAQHRPRYYPDRGFYIEN